MVKTKGGRGSKKKKRKRKVNASLLGSKSGLIQYGSTSNI
jgi:hypothetical protein